MNCSEVESRLTESLDEAGSTDIRAHLFDCSECRRLWQELQAIEALNFSLAHMAGAPVDFTQRVTRRLRKKRLRQTALTIAATVVLCCVGLLIFQAFPENTQPGSGIAAGGPVQTWQPAGISNPGLFADPLASTDLEEQYLEIILGGLPGSSSMIGVPSEIKVHRTDMGKVNRTHVSH